ncbi:hypothetical protein OROGR_005556 [Orobanche gracilis]
MDICTEIRRCSFYTSGLPSPSPKVEVQFGPAHKYPEGKLRVLLLGDDEDEGDVPSQFVLEESPLADESSPKELFQGSCSVLEKFGALSTATGGKTLKLEGAIASIPIVMLVDSGATHNFVSRKLVLSLGLPITTFPGIRIKLGDGYTVIITQQCCNFTMEVGTCSFLLNALVFETGDLDMVLGMEWLQSLGEVTHNWQLAWMRFLYHGKWVTLNGITTSSHIASLHQCLSLTDMLHPSNAATLRALSAPSSLQMVLDQFDAVMRAPSGLPLARSHDHAIVLVNPAEPISLRPYHYPHVQKTEIEKQVRELLDLGMIRPNKSAFSTPVLLVKKKDQTWRMCVDYHALNKTTIPDKFPIPMH